MTILISGASGRIGSDLVRNLSKNFKIIAIYNSKKKLIKLKNVMWIKHNFEKKLLIKFKNVPKYIIHCAVNQKYLQNNNKRYFQLTKEFYRKNLNDLNNIFYSHQVRWNQYNVIKNFFNLDKDVYSRENLEKDFLGNLDKRFDQIETIKKAQIIETNTLLSGYLLSSQGDRMTMAHGVEGRYPYLDDKLNIELANISPKSKAPCLKLKNILRKSFEKILPNEIVNRPKFAYQAPEAKVFFNNKKGLEIVNEFIDGLPNNEKLNKDSFMNLISKFKNPDISSRLGFRENMAFIIGLSDHFLKKMSANWSTKNNSNKENINYEYIN